MFACVELSARYPLLRGRNVLLAGGQYFVSSSVLFTEIFLSRFDKCLKMGMKLEAIREDRTRGGRSTYQCSYTIPPELHASLPPGIAEYRTTQERQTKHPDIPDLLQVQDSG